MPYLREEPDIFPLDLFEREDLGIEEDCGWWGMYTRSRQEKKLMEQLRTLEIDFYCPIARVRRRTPAGRIHTAHLPIFSNYVFVHGNEMDRYRAVSTGRVSKCLKVIDGIALTRELRQLQQLLSKGKLVRPEARLQPGKPVRIRSGPLRNIEGAIIRREGKSRLLISVKFLEQGASVALEDWEVEPLGRVVTAERMRGDVTINAS
ncbi:MAG: antitermination protein NusG [Pirellulales bacterium]|nr:antitermination protein NusG [Pirellulales bacterium]